MIPKEIQSFTLPVKKLVYSKRIQDCCKLPYTTHKNGCPCYGKKDSCPPETKLIDHYFDLTKPLYIVYEEFDLEAHSLKMKNKHPNWTDKQTRNLLYWQAGVRKKLNDKILYALTILNAEICSKKPEALGVNVYATAFLSGLKLERIKGLKIHRQIAIVGYRL